MAAPIVELTFRRLTRADYLLLAQWLADPRVARWWNHEWTPEAIERDFGSVVDGRELATDWIALADGAPLGVVQCCRLADYPEYLGEFDGIAKVPDGAYSIDYLIGPADQSGRGLGTQMIAAFAEQIWLDHPDAAVILVPVVAANRSSWRALERAGFRRVGEGPMKPDNPIDDPLHYVSRLDRPG